MLSYPILLEPDGDTVLATSPDFPELATFGEDREDALFRAVDALETAIAHRIDGRDDIPRPSDGEDHVTLSTQIALKVALYQAMREQGVKKSELGRRLNWHSPQVDRLFDIHHASRLDQVEAAFAALGLRLDLQVAAE